MSFLFSQYFYLFIFFYLINAILNTSFLFSQYFHLFTFLPNLFHSKHAFLIFTHFINLFIFLLNPFHSNHSPIKISIILRNEISFTHLKNIINLYIIILLKGTLLSKIQNLYRLCFFLHYWLFVTLKVKQIFE